MDEKFILNWSCYVNSIKLAFNTLKRRTKNAYLYILIVFSLIFLKALMDLDEKKLRDIFVKGKSVDRNTACLVAFMIFKFWYWSIMFVTRIIFEILITPIGGIVTSKIIDDIICSEGQRATELKSLNVEYFTTEGSKSVAKILRIIFVDFLGSLIEIIIKFYYMYTKDKSNGHWASLLFIAMYLMFAGFRIKHYQKIFKLAFETSKADCQKEDYYIETLDTMKIVKSYGGGRKLVDRYANAAICWETLTVKNKLMIFAQDFYFNTFSEFLNMFSILIFIRNLNYSVSDCPQQTEIHMNSTKTFFSNMKYVPDVFKLIFDFYTQLAESVVLSKKLIGFINYVKEDIRTKIRVDEFKSLIQVADLNYTIGDKHVIKDATFAIQKGMKCAVHGKNGSGKSSVSKVLLGLDEYTGTIQIDGVDLHSICKSDYRKLITYVPQDTKLFSDTIYYNLTFGNYQPYERVIEECKKMDIHDTIMSFSMGYNTHVGDFGNKINGGLRQKIFYTRAFLRSAQIYIFDEPTNNLDVNHSKFLLKYINDDQYKDKTFIVICHDREIVYQFPVIFKFDSGKVYLEKSTFESV